ncbi:MAG: hypothetical protein UT13_C0001G0324 [Candidatus Pacebacteria bacterium GW2011_GWF2_38_9]|nr:MAG: hypothetical protein US01_C0001G0332 [candidate division TM6 bacterium GW2011_GWF2_28_16]KKQ10313.1 MAG: hypothetical protein US20_C0001G0027 [Candidatus Pacebacteria bacterium GW2011_GWF1_36_5]KKQ88677.1 MAG: hypothetical protein UT13_C0001G0324 [Candidatus Pacebacteria bacterium GW2011_GWF2_38_9]HAZ73677.1 hypothetical protein [Candidatus Paceibacterota bacterium]
MDTKSTITPKLIAPCGMNCGLCFHHLKDKDKCPGCLSGRMVNKRCLNCAIKLCKERKGDYCFDCDKFPCDRINHIDTRYKKRYGMSMLENLEIIKNKGMDYFLKQQKQKYVTSEGTYCVHDKKRY